MTDSSWWYEGCERENEWETKKNSVFFSLFLDVNVQMKKNLNENPDYDYVI